MIVYIIIIAAFQTQYNINRDKDRHRDSVDIFFGRLPATKGDIHTQKVVQTSPLLHSAEKWKTTVS